MDGVEYLRMLTVETSCRMGSDKEQGHGYVKMQLFEKQKPQGEIAARVCGRDTLQL